MSMERHSEYYKEILVIKQKQPRRENGHFFSCCGCCVFVTLELGFFLQQALGRELVRNEDVGVAAF